MNRNKKIEVNASSILGLKAELLRQEEEYKKAKLQREIGIKQIPSNKNKKPNVWSKQNVGVVERSQRDFEEKKEEEDVLLKSRKALEAKTKLYEQMSKTMPSDEVSENYLVDFQRKVINSIKDKNEEISDDEKEYSEISKSSEPDEDWVDYVDSLGRSRRCLRKDLQYLTQLDKSLLQRDRPVNDSRLFTEEKEKIEDLEEKFSEEGDDEFKDEGPTFDEPTKPVGPVHYQNVQENEIRNHGVGYFAFSTTEEERRKQQELLESLRKQTQTQKSNRKKMKEKRKAMLNARLQKVQQRKNIQISLPVDEDDSESENPSGQESDKPKETTAPDPAVIAERQTTVRPWDKGKIGVRNEHYQRPQAKKSMSENEWLQNQRSERIQEFAPPQFYFDSVKQKNLEKNWTANSSGIKSEDAQTSQLPPSVADIPLPPGVG